MAIDTTQKAQVVRDFRMHDGDTGSAQVQIALLTQHINDLSGHFDSHPKDHHSRQGLLGMVGRRRRLLDYLKRTDLESYRRILEELNLRK